MNINPFHWFRKKERPTSGRKIVIITAAIIFAAAAITLIGYWSQKERIFSFRLHRSEIQFPKVGSNAEDFSLASLGGKQVALSDYEGKKAVVINFWASWSPFAVDEMRDWATVQEQYNNDLEVLALNRAEDRATAEQFAERVEALGKYPLLLDANDGVWKQYQGFAMPTTVFIDKNGVIKEVKSGPLTLSEMREKAENLLGNRK